MTKIDPADIFVFCAMIAFFSFILYLIVQARIEKRKIKKEQENKK